jgi:hypothetical protein
MRRLLPLVLAIAGANAAEIRLLNGQVLTGQVLGRNDTEIVVKLAEGALVTLKADEVQAVTGADAPSPGKAQPRVQPGTYAEIPVTGAIGKDIFASALVEGVVRAHQLGMRDVVFTIDSAGWNDIDEARAVFRELGRYNQSVRMHALVRDCRGDALAVLLQCETVHLLPGARIGGIDGPADENIQRAELARRVAAAATARGWPGRVFSAMVDPAEVLVAWKDESGQAQFGEDLPADVPAERKVLSVAAGTSLVLTESVLKQSRLRFVDDAAGVGTALAIAGWQAGPAVPREVVAQTAEQLRNRRADAANQMQQSIERAVSRRDAAEEVLRASVKSAAEWDPAKGDYATYHNDWGWGWGGDSNQLTSASRKDWKARTDNALRFLDRAGGAVKELVRYEDECERLGVPRKRSKTQLDTIFADLQAKALHLQKNRDRKEK